MLEVQHRILVLTIPETADVFESEQNDFITRVLRGYGETHIHTHRLGHNSSHCIVVYTC